MSTEFRLYDAILNREHDLKITIITVCFNTVDSIERTIQSVIGQTYENIEYIVIDGDSTDGTKAILEKYKSVINKLISETDLGLYDAMNKGIAHSTGDLIGILNADDIFYSSQVLEKIANFHFNHSVEASIGDIVQLGKNGKVFRAYSSASWTVEKLRFGYMPPHPSIFLKREIFNRFGVYSLDFKIAADFELLVRFFLVNKISWKYTNLITTSMQLGGLSSSGFVSYKIITAEMRKALLNNRVRFSSFFIYLRFLGKIQGLLYGKTSQL